MLHSCVFQQRDRRKAHTVFGMALEEVQHDRHDRRHSADEKQRRQECHYAVLDLVDRYASNAISRGSLVLSS